MKSTQISPMFMYLTETEEATLCGGETLLFSKRVYHKVITVKGSAGKPGVKKQTVQSTSNTKVVKTINKGKIPQGISFDFLSSLLNFDWF
ncbi:hypothetical protein PQG02_16890 [Nostoc sp. UHCC 0926]|uniref:hypothetical protein n=1 Tax=unclassified Nostoc TaxID=2593658 RepID=UPI0023616621|nr:hypothetical protein [Nostoc sp. UHCC 0926]WDD30458.1 hypothetical protein PQG02_16890 [Nostoc sp. UHCC 0926]